jgi:drug/metabolite transporter (DMT)-like permease
MGLVAVVLWSSSVAFIRTLAEQMGPFSTVAFSYLFAGVVTLGVTAYSPGGLRQLWRQPTN